MVYTAGRLVYRADWIVIRRNVICEKDQLVLNYLIGNAPWENYERIMIDHTDIPFENREDLTSHRFRTVSDGQKVMIFKKIK